MIEWVLWNLEKREENIIFEFEYLILNWKLVKYGNIRALLEKWDHNFWSPEKKKVEYIESNNNFLPRVTSYKKVTNAGEWIINDFCLFFNVEQCKLVGVLDDSIGKWANYRKFWEPDEIIEEILILLFFTQDNWRHWMRKNRGD